MLTSIRSTAKLAVLALALTACQGLRQSVLSMKIRAYTDPSDWKDENLHIFFGGTGVVGSDARAGSSVAVVANQEVFLFDCGPGSTRTLLQGHVPLEWSTTVFITHLHSDHFGDLGELTIASQLAGRPTPLILYGPIGTERLASGFQEAYATDLDFRIAQHPTHLNTERGQYTVIPITGAPTEKEADTPQAGQLLLDRDGIRISALTVEHAPAAPAFAYKIEFGGRTVVISGDMAYYSPLAAFAANADLLIHEAMDKNLAEQMSEVFASHGATNTSQLILEAMPNHSSSVDAGRLATEAKAKRLVLTHLSPPLLTKRWKRDLLKGARSQYSGPASLAEDGMLIELKVKPDSTQNMLK